MNPLSFLYSCPSEILDFLVFVVCVISIACTYKFFGILGLYAYNVIATITSNIQVMKVAQYSYIAESMSLGTVVFSTIFIVDAIIIERHGGSYARHGLFISMSAYFLFVVFMHLTMYYPTTASSAAASYAIENLFSTSSSIFISSLAAYFISQFFEIYFYALLKKVTSKKILWVRYNLANAGAMLLDQFVFSILCWKILGTRDISLSYIFKNYIVFNYLIRLAISFASTPLAYFIQRIKPLKV